MAESSSRGSTTREIIGATSLREDEALMKESKAIYDAISNVDAHLCSEPQHENTPRNQTFWSVASIVIALCLRGSNTSGSLTLTELLSPFNNAQNMADANKSILGELCLHIHHARRHCSRAGILKPASPPATQITSLLASFLSLITCFRAYQRYFAAFVLSSTQSQAHTSRTAGDLRYPPLSSFPGDLPGRTLATLTDTLVNQKSHSKPSPDGKTDGKAGIKDAFEFGWLLFLCSKSKLPRNIADKDMLLRLLFFILRLTAFVYSPTGFPWPSTSSSPSAASAASAPSTTLQHKSFTEDKHLLQLCRLVTQNSREAGQSAAPPDVTAFQYQLSELAENYVFPILASASPHAPASSPTSLSSTAYAALSEKYSATFAELRMMQSSLGRVCPGLPLVVDEMMVLKISSEAPPIRLSSSIPLVQRTTRNRPPQPQPPDSVPAPQSSPPGRANTQLNAPVSRPMRSPCLVSPASWLHSLVQASLEDDAPKPPPSSLTSASLASNLPPLPAPLWSAIEHVQKGAAEAVAESFHKIARKVSFPTAFSAGSVDSSSAISGGQSGKCSTAAHESKVVLSMRLCYIVLAEILVKEQRRLQLRLQRLSSSPSGATPSPSGNPTSASNKLSKGIQSMVKSADFHAALLCCCLQLVVFAHKVPSMAFPYLLSPMSVSGWNLFKVIETVCIHLPEMPRALVNHCREIEGKLLERLVWDVSSSPREILPILLKNARLETIARSLANPPVLVSSSAASETAIEDALKQMYTYTRWQSPPPVPVSVALLFRKLVLVAAERLTILCSDNILQVPPLVIELTWALVSEVLHYHALNLLLNRHLDTLLLCSLYAVCKVAKLPDSENLFQNIITVYKSSSLYGLSHEEATSRITINPKDSKDSGQDPSSRETFYHLISFYNKVFLAEIKVFVMTKLQPLLAACPDLHIRLRPEASIIPKAPTAESSPSKTLAAAHIFLSPFRPQQFPSSAHFFQSSPTHPSSTSASRGSTLRLTPRTNMLYAFDASQIEKINTMLNKPPVSSNSANLSRRRQRRVGATGFEENSPKRFRRLAFDAPKNEGETGDSSKDGSEYVSDDDTFEGDNRNDDSDF